MSYASYMSRVNYMSYVNYMSNVNFVSYMRYMSLYESWKFCKLYEILNIKLYIELRYELRKLYEYFYESIKIV